VDHGEDQTQVPGNRRLQGQEPLDRVLDAKEVAVDLVVERDYLVGELAISLLERADRSADGAQDALPHLLELRFDAIEGFVDGHRDTVHPAGTGISVYVTTP